MDDLTDEQVGGGWLFPSWAGDMLRVEIVCPPHPGTRVAAVKTFMLLFSVMTGCASSHRCSPICFASNSESSSTGGD